MLSFPRSLLALLLVLCSTVSVSRGKLILSNGQDYVAVSLGFPRGGTPSSATFRGPIVLADPVDGCTLDNAKDIFGKILVTQGSKCFPAVKARNAQNAGAVALIAFSYGNPFGSTKYFQSSQNERDVLLPGFEVSNAFKQEIVQAIQIEPNMTASVFGDPSRREVVLASGYWIFFAVSNGVVNLVIAAIALYRLLNYIWKKNFSAATLTHLLLCSGCVARIVHMIDFNGSYDLLHYVDRTFLIACSLVLTINSAVAIGFFWLDLFDRENLETRVSFLKRFKIHTFVVVSLISVLSLIISILNAYLVNVAIISLIGILLYTIITFVVFVFFSYCCHMIKRYLLTRFQNESNKITKALKKLFVLGVLQCIGIAIFVILAGVLASPVASDPIGFSIDYSILTYTATALSLVQISMFSNPKNKFVSKCLGRVPSGGEEDPTSKSNFSKEEFEMKTGEPNQDSDYPGTRGRFATTGMMTIGPMPL